MPLQSREVVTCRLIYDCADETDLQSDPDETPSQSGLLGLPVEVRLKILRYLLRIDYNRQCYTRRPTPDAVDKLLRLDSRRILEAPQFRHKGKQDINGSLPVIKKCQLDVNILRTCKTICREAKTVLYAENKVLAVQSGVKSLGTKLRNYGIPVWGPLIFENPGGDRKTAEEADEEYTSFNPVILFTNQKTKPGTPVYICSYKDAQDLLHALWIMIKSPFARGMKFSAHITVDARFRPLSLSDALVKHTVLPWLHNHINEIVCDDPARRVKMADRLQAHKNASKLEPNVYTYNTICTYLEQLMQGADRFMERSGSAFLKAEMVYERVQFEACSLVRTRTASLVDVSSKSKDGINRVCKLIALSAYRLCELRSGAAAIPKRRVEKTTDKHSTKTNHKSPLCRPANVTSSDMTSREAAEITLSLSSEDDSLEQKEIPPSTTVSNTKPATTRLDRELAREFAIVHGLLALRLPCATSVTEWNVRLNVMLMRLFAEDKDTNSAYCCMSRIHQNWSVVLKEAKAKNKTGQKWRDLETLVYNLTPGTKLPVQPEGNTVVTLISIHDRHTQEWYLDMADRCQEAASGLWGERLAPKKNYVGLIWTFRWA